MPIQMHDARAVVDREEAEAVVGAPSGMGAQQPDGPLVLLGPSSIGDYSRSKADWARRRSSSER